MRNRTTHFLTVSLAITSVFCVIIFSVQSIWNHTMGAKAITDLGIIYMSGMSEQMANHFGTTIELQLEQVQSLADSVQPESADGGTKMRESLTRIARSRGFEYLAFYMADGEFDMVYGSRMQSGLPEAFLHSLLKGEEKVSAGWDEEGAPVVMMGIPVSYAFEDGTNCIALVAGRPVSYLSDTLALNVDASVVDYSIIRRNGSFILHSNHMKESVNYFERVDSLYERISGKDPKQYAAELTDAMDHKRDYTSEVQVAGERYNLYCTGLPNSEWHLLLYMSYGNIDETIQMTEKLSQQALRVIAVAYKKIQEIPTHLNSDNLENHLTLLGLVGMIDPPRKEAKIAVATCLQAGIKPVMITGDHIVTASAIAKELGIMQENDYAILGNELSKMSDEELSQKISQISVYARVSPEDKIRVVKAWQNQNAIVAMTGDGVNDAPALKQSDIGIAMGKNGTDVSKDAADMILTDDNFATIVKAIMTGRNVYCHIKNSIHYLLSGNFAIR